MSAKILEVTLQDQFDDITATTRRLVQLERMALSERVIAELLNSRIEEKILPFCAEAPTFTLNDASGRPMLRPICSPSGL